MALVKETTPHSAIATADEHSITVRGMDLCTQLIGEVSFTDYFYFLVTGQMPNADQRYFTDAVLVSIAEHGMTTSAQAARMTLAASPEAMQAAVAAGILGCGTVVLGSAESAGKFLSGLVAEAKESGKSFEDVARAGLQDLRAKKRSVPGYGHPKHHGGDPRTERLLALAEKRKTVGDHIKMLYTVEKIIPEVYQRELPINVSGAIPAVILDVGFPVAALKGIPILARTASLIAHLNEEMQRPIGFILSRHSADTVVYSGPPAKTAA